MDIASSWGGGVDISMAAVTYPKLQAYKDGGVLVWYEDAGVQTDACRSCDYEDQCSKQQGCSVV